MLCLKRSNFLSAVDTAFAKLPLGFKLRAVLSEGRGTNVAIADFLLRNPVRATAWGIEELAANTQTSTATLSRFARTLGFNGFAALRSGMADALQHALQRKGETASSSNPIIAESLEASVSNFQSAATGLNPAMLVSIAHKILAADTVYIQGFGISAHLSAMLALDLQPFCRQAINVVEFGGTEVAAGRLMNIGPKDLLIAISFPRYASDAVMLTRYARDRSAHVIALTDSMASPLVNWSHDVLVAQAEKLTDAISAYLYTDKPGNDSGIDRPPKRIVRG